MNDVTPGGETVYRRASDTDITKRDAAVDAPSRPAHPRNVVARERFSATHDWFWTTSTVGAIFLAIFLGFAIPNYGYLPFVFVGLTALAGPLVVFLQEDVSERTYSVSHVTWLIGLGFSAAATGGADSFLLPLLVVYTLGFFSRLRPAVATVHALVSFALSLVPVLVFDWAGFVESPWLLISCALGLFSMTMFAAQMAAGEIRQRGRATFDQLTGLLNRRGLEERLAELGQQATVIGEDVSLAVIACDLDRFKSINDEYGHQRGDDVLRDVARIIRRALRRFELVYRMGGEEFLVVLPGHDLAAASEAAEAIRVAVEDGLPGGLKVTMSLGVAACSAHGYEVDQLLVDADTALYAAKTAGRNTVVQARPAGGAQPAILNFAEIGSNAVPGS